MRCSHCRELFLEHPRHVVDSRKSGSRRIPRSIELRAKCTKPSAIVHEKSAAGASPCSSGRLQSTAVRAARFHQRTPPRRPRSIRCRRGTTARRRRDRGLRQGGGQHQLRLRAGSRIATFDNDGTPGRTADVRQVLFAFDRIRVMNRFIPVEDDEILQVGARGDMKGLSGHTRASASDADDASSMTIRNSTASCGRVSRQPVIESEARSPRWSTSRWSNCRVPPRNASRRSSCRAAEPSRGRGRKATAFRPSRWSAAAAS